MTICEQTTTATRTSKLLSLSPVSLLLFHIDISEASPIIFLFDKSVAEVHTNAK